METSDRQILSDGLQMLRRANIQINAGDLHDLDLRLPDGSARHVDVKVSRTAPPPSRLREDRRRQAVNRTSRLYVTHHATDTLRALADSGEVDLIAVADQLIIFDGYVFLDAPPRELRSRQRPRRGSPPWIRWAIERLLLLSEPMTQKDIAGALSTTQQATSRTLHDHPFAERTPRGWTMTRRNELLEVYLNEYPGPGGAVTYWYGLDPVVRQAETALGFCEEMEVGGLQTGDVAADSYAPWRLPTTAAIYTSEFVDFVPAGFSPATIDDHTMVATVPADPTLWRTAHAVCTTTTALADPIIALHDVLRSPGPDAAEAADRLRQAIERGSWRD
ncbi:hypothetical protein [Prescottella agglutinans]|uniref:hypothetical protein n=1 Tax=Prescottella agglutinans TaxID=1644129 RepID=UPI003D959567